jgi:hypothetical protein
VPSGLLRRTRGLGLGHQLGGLAMTENSTPNGSVISANLP